MAVKNKNPSSSQTVPIHEFLEQEIERSERSKLDFAEEIGVSRSTLYNALSGDHDISRNLAIKIAGVLGHTHDFWLRSEVFVGENSNVVHLSDKTKAGAPSPGEGNAPQLLTDEMIKSAVASQLISISGYNSRNLKPASYDLTLGRNLRMLSREHGQNVALDKSDYVIQHMDSASATTKEVISLPRNYVARVGATAELAKLGIIVNHGLQIDPGFSGPLDISILNASGRPFSLFLGQVIISMELYYLPIAPETAYRTDNIAKIDLAYLRQLIAAKFTAKSASDGKFLISWDAACLEVLKDGPEDMALKSVLEMVANKLENDNPPHQLMDGLTELARGMTPSETDIDSLMESPEMRRLVAAHFKGNTPPRPSISAGEETMRAIFNQWGIPLSLLFLAALQSG